MKYQSSGLFGSTSFESDPPMAWRLENAPREFSHMNVIYKCGCRVERCREAGHACSKHGKGIKRIERITEYVDVPARSTFKRMRIEIQGEGGTNGTKP